MPGIDCFRKEKTEPNNLLIGLTAASLTAAGLILLLGGCLSKADPAQIAGFIDPMKVSYHPDIPFQGAWIKPFSELRNYRKVFFSPVHTDYLHQMTWWQDAGHLADKEKGIQDIALFTRETFETTFRDAGYQVLAQPQAGCLIIEVAMTEVVPSKPALAAAGLLPPLMIPAAAAGFFAKSSAAFEARLTDYNTQEIVALFADREAQKTSIVNLKNFTWYGHAKSLVREWAGQFVQVLRMQPGQKIEDSPTFNLKPW